MAFFTQHPCCTTYFLPTAAKSKQKRPLEGSTGFFMKHGFAQLNNPTWMLGLGTNHQGSVFDYLKGFTFLSCVYIRLGRQTHLTSMLNALLNSQNNRRALSRG
jgi:hypothetical protein